MPKYVALVDFTDKGVESIKSITERVKGFGDLASRMGVTVKSHYFTSGRHDAIVVMEAPDTATASALALSIGAQGNVRTEMLEAFSLEEMEGIVAKMP